MTANLNTIKVLAGWSKAQLDLFAEYLEPMECAQGTVIIEQGAHADAMYFLNEGQVAVYRSAAGGARVFLRTFDAGANFGEMSLLEPSNRTATVEARTRCSLLKLSKTNYDRVLQDSMIAVPFLQALCRSLAVRLASISIRYAEVSSQVFV